MALQTRRPARPISLPARLVLIYLICAICAGLAVSIHGKSAQSSRVQANGVQDNATVVSVDNEDRNGLTAEVTVHLHKPVNGTFDSVVHDPGWDNSRPGDTITVLVDPQHPDYSELPGLPATSGSWVWILLLGMSVFLFLGGIHEARKGVHLSRRRRAVGDFAHPGNPRDRF